MNQARAGMDALVHTMDYMVDTTCYVVRTRMHQVRNGMDAFEHTMDYMIDTTCSVIYA